MSQADEVLSRIDVNLDAALERLLILLRIRSISTDPGFRRGMRSWARIVHTLAG